MMVLMTGMIMVSCTEPDALEEIRIEDAVTTDPDDEPINPPPPPSGG